MDNLSRIALQRLGLVSAPEGPPSPAVAAATLTELTEVGIRIANPERLTDGFAAEVAPLVKTMRRLRGEKGVFTPLFKGFPEKLPEFDDAELRFTLARARLGNTLPSVEDWRSALDFSDLGWWPASSLPQDEVETIKARFAQQGLAGDTRTEWTTLTLVSASEMEEALKGYMQDTFSSAASLREDVRTDLEALVQTYGAAHVDVDRVRFRETRTLLLKLVWNLQREAIARVGATPDDLLRLFADLTGGDVSLSQTVTYPRFSRADRRIVVAALEATPRLEELFRRRGLWLSIAKGLHVGEFDAPRLNEALGRLRASRHDKTSFASRFEALLASDYAGALDLAQSEAPGVLVRSLRRVASLAVSEADETSLVETLASVGASVPLRLLLAARSQIADNGATYPRVVFTKSGAAMLIDREPGHLALSASRQGALVTTLDSLIETQMAEKDSWAGERVFVSPETEKLLLPDQLRSTAQGLVQVERGSRLPLGDARVVRLFVHWKDASITTDLDLSALALDEDFNVASYVSWTNLGNGAMTYSGDITSAPLGAEEFIDLDLSKVKNRGWRYIAPAIFRYSGDTFENLTEASVGWMLRDACSSDRRTFDAKTVQNAFALTGSRRTALPILLDLKTREILYVDVYLSGGPTAQVERDGTSITSLVSAAAARTKTKVSVSDLAVMHAAARGAELVFDEADATISFGVDDTATYNALRPEKILAELL